MDIINFLKKFEGQCKSEHIPELLQIFINRSKCTFGAVFSKNISTRFDLITQINMDDNPKLSSLKNDVFISNKGETNGFNTSHKIHNIIIIPIIVSHEIVGAVCLGNKETDISINLIDEIKDLISFGEVIINKYKLIDDYKKVYSDSTFSKDLFLANMSHEIRTPLNGIIGFNQLLSQTNLNDTQKSYLKSISQCGIQLMHIINDILDYSRLSSGIVGIDKECFYIKEIIDILETTMGEKIKNMKQTCKYIIDPNIPHILVSDKQKIIQITMNLLSNANKFTHVGGTIEISFKIVNDFLSISVKDNGIGISTQDQYKLFNSFIQINKSLTKNGTGLGLAISKRLVEILEGEINVESSIGKGTTFTFTCKHFPYSEFEKSIKKDFKSIKGKSVLVVDDNEDNRILITDILFEWKMKPIVCASPLEALRMILGNRYHFDIGLIDICMPKISGVELAAQIKEERPLFPLIALSSLNGFVDCTNFEVKLDKPINKIHLFNAIHRIITQVSYSPGSYGLHNKEPKSPISSPDSERYSGSSSDTSPPNPSLRTILEDSKIRDSPCNISISQFNKNKKILIAEDIQHNQDLLKSMLTSLKYKNIDIVSNGLEAIDKLEKTKYDILLLDLRMPKMDGYDVIDFIKNNKIDIDIIIITASVLEEDKRRCAFYDIKYFLSKPLDLNQLKNILLRLCKRKS